MAFIVLGLVRVLSMSPKTVKDFVVVIVASAPAAVVFDVTGYITPMSALAYGTGRM